MKSFSSFKLVYAILALVCFHVVPKAAWSQSKLKISEFALFGGNANVAGKGVQISSSISISGGAIGSYSQIKSTGSAFIGGSLHSGGTIQLTNSNTVKGRISAANSLNRPGNAVEIGSNAVLSGNIDVKGNILVGGGIVEGIVTHPPGTNYVGPTPKGGELKATPQIPDMPDMPQITSFRAAGTKLINNTAKISPGVFGKMSLTGNKTVTFSEPGIYEFSTIKNSGTTNNFIFDFQKNPSGTFRIYVHGDIDLNKISIRIINGGSEAQIYTETHGDGRTSPTGMDAFNIANGSAGTSTKWAGMVWVPNASINIGSGTGGSDVTGALWTNYNIVLQSGVKFNFATSIDLPIIPATPPPPGGKYEQLIGSELNSLFLKGGATDSLSKNVFIVDGSNVYIEVIARIGQYATLLALLKTPAYGLTDQISNGPNSLIITGKYPIANLRKLDLLPDLIDYVRPLFPPLSGSGVAYSKGDISMHTDFIRNGYDVDGEGVRVGVLSDSYNTVTGNPAQTDISNGDLPGG